MHVDGPELRVVLAAILQPAPGECVWYQQAEDGVRAAARAGVRGVSARLADWDCDANELGKLLSRHKISSYPKGRKRLPGSGRDSGRMATIEGFVFKLLPVAAASSAAGAAGDGTGGACAAPDSTRRTR